MSSRATLKEESFSFLFHAASWLWAPLSEVPLPSDPCMWSPPAVAVFRTSSSVMFFLRLLPEGMEKKSLILPWYTKRRALVQERMKADRSLPPVIALLHFHHQPFPQHILVEGIRRLWHGVVSYKVRQTNRIVTVGISSLVQALCHARRCVTGKLLSLNVGRDTHEVHLLLQGLFPSLRGKREAHLWHVRNLSLIVASICLKKEARIAPIPAQIRLRSTILSWVVC